MYPSSCPVRFEGPTPVHQGERITRPEDRDEAFLQADGRLCVHAGGQTMIVHIDIAKFSGAMQPKAPRGKAAVPQAP